MLWSHKDVKMQLVLSFNGKIIKVRWEYHILKLNVSRGIGCLMYYFSGVFLQENDIKSALQLCTFIDDVNRPVSSDDGYLSLLRDFYFFCSWNVALEVRDVV